MCIERIIKKQDGMALVKSAVGNRIEEFILIVLILLNVLEFLNLPAFFILLLAVTICYARGFVMFPLETKKELRFIP